MRDYYNVFLINLIKLMVVEGPVLRDYYNIFSPIRFTSSVVEGPVLKGYYNTGNGSKFKGTIPVYFFLVMPIISFYLCSVNHRNHPGV